MLQFRRRCCSAVWASARSAASTSRFAVTRYTHSQAHQSRVEHVAQYQQKHGEGFWVSRVDGFRYVSAAEPHASTGTSSGVPGRDVVVCIGWMGCKEKHLDQVARTWLSLSPTASIITYRPSPMDVLWPRTGVETAERLVASLPQGCRVVVHGFSTGGYLYSLMMQSLVKRKGLGLCRISGCVFDCAVDMEGIAVGMGHAVSKNGIGQAVVRSLTSIYLFLMFPVVTHLYIKASNLFKNPPAELKVPILMLAGGKDSVASLPTQLRVMHGWQSQGMRCSLKVIDGARHCQLLLHSPQVYVAELRSFFSSLDSPLA